MQTSPAVSSSTVDGSIPVDAQGPADRGCLDEWGELRAEASSWYSPALDGVLELNGERGSSRDVARFGTAAGAAIESIATGFELADGLEYRNRDTGCVTHRYAVLKRGEEAVVVAVWRLEAAADPNWVPNEASFVVIDGSTLVSRGDHIVVVLAVAPDGTTARVSGYGERATALVAGWPSTTMADPTAPQPGRVALTADELIPVARSMLASVLDQR